MPTDRDRPHQSAPVQRIPADGGGDSRRAQRPEPQQQRGAHALQRAVGQDRVPDAEHHDHEAEVGVDQPQASPS